MTGMIETWTDIPLYPVMGEELGAHNAIAIDLSKDNEDLNRINLSDSEQFCSYVDNLRDKQNKKYALGGYLENRVIYSRSHVFATGSSVFRNIHLGVDIWAMPGTTVFCPLGGIIHSFQDNVGFGNYGPTLILEHVLRGSKIYSLYGHLAKSDIGQFRTGKYLSAGELVGHLGEEEENGNWPAHLHFQLIYDLEGLIGDYPGVCRDSEVAHYAQNCPNPNGWLKCGLLQPIN